MYNAQIETFVIVAETGSFSRAAEKLFITPTAVMKQINSLEERLNITLFIRENHRLQLTKTGMSFLQDAKYVIDYSNKAIEKAKNIDKKDKKLLIRIGASIMTPAKFLLDIWSEIQNIVNDIQIELVPFENTPENAREILKNLGQNIDVVAGVYDDEFLNDRECKAIHLSDKTISLAVPLTHKLSNKELIKVNDIINSDIMLNTKGWETTEKMRKELIMQGVNIVDFDFFNLNVFNIAVKTNTPIIAIDEWENIHPLLKIIPVDWNYSIPFGIMYSPNPSKQVVKFIKALQNIEIKK